MKTLFILLPLLSIVIFFILVNWYIAIIKHSNKVKESLSGIDIQLKMRTDLIPNTLEMAQKFMDYESSILSEITTLRTQALLNYNKSNSDEVSEHLTTIENLNDRIQQLFVNVENYPALKSDTFMVQAQKTLNEVEQQISAARRFYNASVNVLNTATQIYPGSTLAKIAGVSEMPFYETRGVNKSINVDDYLK